LGTDGSTIDQDQCQHRGNAMQMARRNCLLMAAGQSVYSLITNSKGAV
jgi:hypothetical protein